MAGSPKVDERYDAYGGYAINEEVFFLHPAESWVRGTLKEIKGVAKKGGFAEVCFACATTSDAANLPGVPAETIFPLRDAEIHHVVGGDGSARGGGDDTVSEECAALSDGTVNDLLQLSYLHDSTLLEQVRRRYFKQLMYTHIGPILLALNPYDFTLKHYVDANVPKYIAEGDAVITRPSVHLPHAWTTAHYSYWLMSTDGKNQSVIVSGESGAGKTETAKIVVKYLGKVSTAQCSPEMRAAAEQVTVRVNLTSPILEAFGNAKTRMNDNSSRFGKFMKVHFVRQGSGEEALGAVMAGAAIEVYLLEKSRICTHGEGERSYHCFYQLLAEGGASTAQEAAAKKQLKQHIKLTAAKDVPSLSIGNATVIPNVDDAFDFEEVSRAMKSVGMDDAEESAVWNVVASVLQLLQVQFKETSDDGCEVVPSANLQALAHLLLINTATLDTELTTTTNVTRGETIVKKLRKAFAIDLRDALAKSLYEALFLWLVARINGLIQPPEAASAGEQRSWIALLDIFGFENFAHGNSFEQMCINLANETLQNHYNSVVFTRDMEECKAEGINTDSVVFYDNQPCLDLICGLNFSKCGPGGSVSVTNRLSIMGLIDESCSLATGTDDSLCGRIAEMYGGKNDGSGAHDNFERPKTQRNAFILKHYAGKVTYTIDGFRAKNADTLKESIKDVIRDSKCDFVSALLGVPVASPTGSGPSSKKTSVGAFFRTQLTSLMTEINSTHPHWIRCVKPHSAKKPRMFNGKEVMTQLCSAGVLETVRIRQQSFSIRLVFSEFVDRYRHVLRAQTHAAASKITSEIIVPDTKLAPLADASLFAKQLQTTVHLGDRSDTAAMAQACRDVLRRCNVLTDKLAQVGKSKVFLRTHAFHVLTQVLRVVKSTLVTSIQAYAQGYRSSRRRRCLELNNKLKLITAFLHFRPSHAIFRQRELKELEKELLTKFRNLMILQGDENKIRDIIQEEHNQFVEDVEAMRVEDLKQRRVEWERKRAALDVQQQEGVILLEADRRKRLVSNENASRDILAELLGIKKGEESERVDIEIEEATDRSATLLDTFMVLQNALQQYLAECLRQALYVVAVEEGAHRQAIVDDESSTFAVMRPTMALCFQEAKARALILEREGLRFKEFPELQQRMLTDIMHTWETRKQYRDRYDSLVLQRDEQSERAAILSEWEQELVMVLEDVNEDEARAIDFQYEREAQEERDKLAIAIEERLLREQEEEQKFAEIRRQAQALWNVAESERRAAAAIREEEKAIVALRREQARLTSSFMEECRRREVAGATLHSSRSSQSTRQLMSASLTRGAERIRQQQLLITVQVQEHEARLAQLRFEQALSSRAPSLKHLPLCDEDSGSLSRESRTSPDAKTRGPKFADLSASRSASQLRITSSQDRSASPEPKSVLSGTAAVHHTSKGLRTTGVQCGGTMEMLERLSVIRSTASSSNYSANAALRSLAQDEELIPDVTPPADRQIRRLARFHGEKKRKLEERLQQLEQDRAAGGIAQRSLSAGTHGGEDRPVRSITYCNPRVHCGLAVNWPPQTRASQTFPKKSKNPFSASWRPVQPAEGTGVPAMLYCYLPDGTLVPIGKQDADNRGLNFADGLEEVIDMDATVMDNRDDDEDYEPAANDSSSPPPRNTDASLTSIL